MAARSRTAVSAAGRRSRSANSKLDGSAQKTAILTARQIQCLRLVSVGESSAQIGKRLGISADVVDEHVVKACRRLNVRTRTQAVLAACLRHLL